MPSASDRMATTVTKGVLKSVRKASFRWRIGVGDGPWPYAIGGTRVPRYLTARNTYGLGRPTPVAVQRLLHGDVQRGSARPTRGEVPFLLAIDDGARDAGWSEPKGDLRHAVRHAKHAGEHAVIHREVIDDRGTRVVGEHRRLETAFDVLEHDHADLGVRAVLGERGESIGAGLCRRRTRVRRSGEQRSGEQRGEQHGAPLSLSENNGRPAVTSST